MGTRFSVLGLAVVCACSSAPAAVGPRQGSASLAGNGAAAAISGSPSTASVMDQTPTANPAPLVPVQPTVPAGTSCRAGHYIGTFTGDYHSGAWFDGSETITFETSDVGDKAGFEFWLESVQKPCLPGQEFCADAVVKGGKLRGNATPFSDPNDPSTAGGAGFSVRFEIDLTGELDCRLGKFKGKLENGCYDILTVLYRFDGTIIGDYSVKTSEFTQGMWHVDEQAMAGAGTPASPLGGDGTWTAAYKDDSMAPTGTGAGLCAGQSGLDTPP